MEHYDIVICGAGVAGVAAALAGARRGKRVLVIEKQTIIGGLATSGLIYIYLPVSGDDGRVVTSGIAEELLRRAPDYGPFDLPEKYTGIPGSGNGHNPDRYCCCFSPAGYALTLEKLLRESGAELLMETSVIGARCDGSGRLCEVELFCGADRWSVSADCFIDASGGAFMLRLAGAEVFGSDNRVTPWLIEQDERGGELPRLISGNLHIAITADIERGVRVEQVLSVAETQDFIRRQYKIIRERYDAPGDRKTRFPVHLPAMPQMRKIARIDAVTRIADGEAGLFRADSVGVAADWRRLAPSWETPYGALVPRRVRGALAAGRCIDSAGDAWEVFRVIPAAAMTGEAAGTAAAMCCDRGIDPAALPVGDLQKELLASGAILHIADGRRPNGGNAREASK